MKLCNKLSIAFLLAGFAAVSVQAEDKKIMRSELPAAVEKAVAAEEARGATAKGFATEIEKGKKFYEAELATNGHSKDVLLDEKGNVVEVEEEVAMDSLSSEVKDGLTKASGSGTISKVESLTKNGKLVAYEAVVKTGTKTAEVQVGPDGKKLVRAQ